jgi:outer membrane protein OmpA-like peptidoglycan-associated protein
VKLKSEIPSAENRMKCKGKMILPLVCMAVTTAICAAQTQQPEPAANVISGTVAAIGYPIGGGTRVNMVGTAAASQASGQAKVEATKDGTAIELRVAGMPQPTALGAEFLTYVSWTVTPDGTTTNLGEISIDQSGQGKLQVKAQSQTFALIVTAEPYYAVRMPSELVVLVNETRKNTKGKIYPDNTYKLMKRGEYSKLGNPLALTPDLKKVPLAMYQARNAVDIAKSRGADQYAPGVFSKAQSSLRMAENALSQNSSKNQVISAARQTIQFAEDARALAVQRETAERILKEKEAAAATAAAKAKAEADAQAATETKRRAELTSAKEAQMTAQAAAQAAEAKAAAAAAASKAAAEQAALQAKEEAAKEEAARAHAATAALRVQLLQQLNDVLQTRDTPQGLVVNMADVLFEVAKYGLSTEAQLKLAKLSGIIQAHPGLNLAIEGYTDNTGTADFNLKLSQQRADTVRQFLITQGLSQDGISSQGLGQANPIADNSTATGRKQNRRVEIIVSGEVIGIQIGK